MTIVAMHACVHSVLAPGHQHVSTIDLVSQVFSCLLGNFYLLKTLIELSFECFNFWQVYSLTWTGIKSMISIRWHQTGHSHALSLLPHAMVS